MMNDDIILIANERDKDYKIIWEDNSESFFESFHEMIEAYKKLKEKK